MDNNLAEALVQKGVIKRDTEVQAVYTSTDLSGVRPIELTATFAVKRMIKQLNGDIVFDLAYVTDGKIHKIRAENVLTIDGMDPSRIANVYNLKSDGSVKTVGKKRGRKPKNLKQALMNAK